MHSTNLRRTPAVPIVHRGASKLVISIDVGATSSAVAWQLLERDTAIQPPTNVAKWTGAHSDHDVKVPTSILYEEGKPIKFGKDAEDDEGLPGTTLIRNPKLVLHPKWLQDLASAPLPSLIPGEDPISTFDKPVIPPPLTINKVYIDFLTYLIEHTRRSFSQTRLGGVKLFDELLPSAHWLLGAPNAWSPVEKQVLVSSLTATGYCHAKSNIQVISEAEASLLWLVHTSPQAVPLAKDALLTVCDAGGSTIDITLYRCVDPVAMTFVEVGTPLCVQKGAYYVSKALGAYVKPMFTKHARFAEDAESYVKNIVADFDSSKKQSWDGTKTGDERLRFTSEFTRLTDASFRGGKLTVPAEHINKAFDTCVPHVVSSLRERVRDSQGKKADAILLVGGFGDSPYLQRVLHEQFEEAGPKIPLVFPSITALGVKAVSAGGVYIVSKRESGVTARAALFTYGVCVNVPYDENNPEHRGRRTITMQDGKRYVQGRFERLINKGETTTSDDFRSSVRFIYEADTEIALRRYIGTNMFIYIGDGLPDWMHEKGGKWTPGFYKVGSISGYGLRVPIMRMKKEEGTIFYESDFRIGVSFGGLEIKARIERVDGSDFGQEVAFKAGVFKEKEEERKGFSQFHGPRRYMKCAPR